MPQGLALYRALERYRLATWSASRRRVDGLEYQLGLPGIASRLGQDACDAVAGMLTAWLHTLG